MTTELARPLTLEAARRTRAPVEICASAEERAALAGRFALVALDALNATVSVAVERETVLVEGTLSASLVQACVATSEPVPAAITAPIALKLVPAADLAAIEADADIELADSDLDILEHDGATIDLGELVAQSLALALDPWPRHPDADAVLKAAGVKSEEEAGAFGALAQLRDRLRG